MDLFGIGAPELVMILVIAFLLLGPERMGDIAKGAGKAMREVRRNVAEVTRVVEDATAEQPKKAPEPQPEPKSSVKRDEEKQYP